MAASNARNAEMLAELRRLLHDVFVAQAEGALGNRLSRAHGYVDGYMRALIESGACTRNELLKVVAEERANLHGPATREVRGVVDASEAARVVAA